MSVTINPSSGYGAIPLSGASSITLNGNTSDELTQAVGVTLKIMPANGGTIISIRNDSSFSSVADLYVIAEDQDIGSEIGKIITLHYLKRKD